MLLAHAVEGPTEPGLEVAEDTRVDPGQDLTRGGGVEALDPPIVADADTRQPR
jgi:hypothetical protein